MTTQIFVIHHASRGCLPLSSKTRDGSELFPKWAPKFAPCAIISPRVARAPSVKTERRGFCAQVTQWQLYFLRLSVWLKYITRITSTLLSISLDAISHSQRGRFGHRNSPVRIPVRRQNHIVERQTRSADIHSLLVLV